MKFIILSHEMAEDENWILSLTGTDNPLMISITDTRNNLAKIPIISEENILRLEFHDIDRKGNDQYILFDAKEADKILDFINAKLKDDFNLVIVHCGAGVSRSPGVAAALSYILNGTDEEIIKHKPLFNRRVYSTIITTFRNKMYLDKNYYTHINKFFQEKCKAKKS